MNIDKLRQRYPSRFKSSPIKKVLLYVFGSALIVMSIAGGMLEIAKILNLYGVTKTAVLAMPIRIILTILILLTGVTLFKSAKGHSNPDNNWFVNECKCMFDEITSNGYANNPNLNDNTYDTYTLDQLIDSYRSIDREKNPDRFRVLSYRILKELS